MRPSLEQKLTEAVNAALDAEPKDLDLLGTPGGVHFRKAHQKVWICYRGKKICYRGKKTLESLDLLSG